MLGLFPKMTIIHTGKHVEGQVYLPEVNYMLMILCIAVSVGFQSTDHLGDAYGKEREKQAAIQGHTP
jgi:KUP system potassium uptake protein